MAYNDEDLCTNHADFAVICSFIDKFGEKLGLTLPNIGELQTLLEDTDNVSPILGQTVSQLLRRINKSVKTDRWERGLQRFAHSYSHQDGWELERFGFKKAKLECKIRVLKNLMEAQFDMYKSFKDKINLISAKELRLQPYGRDKKGVSYWCQLDDCANLRVYCDDQDEETWTLVAISLSDQAEMNLATYKDSRIDINVVFLNENQMLVPHTYGIRFFRGGFLYCILPLTVYSFIYMCRISNSDSQSYKCHF
nr:LOW QUALITY PROTEIN: remodeling and spacing factor 1-like [Penaeus vannamei]